jgi:dTDP-glucose 4,6-dehydratase
MKSILVTGGAGFIGSNFIKFMLKKYPYYKIINLDALTYAGNLQNLNEVSENMNYVFVKANICQREKIDKIFKDYDISAVINFAAESHVDRSIEDPELFIRTNIIGTNILLEIARKNWSLTPNDKYCRKYKSGVKYLQISTDEVYGALGKDGFFNETMSLMPNSPYSASKASADMLVRAYHETFGLPISITRCSNNYGPYQFPEKLIPLMIINCMNDKKLPVYGDGMQIRDWLHVEDHCSAIDVVLHKGKDGEVYNIGGNNEKYNIEIVKLIIHKLGKSEELIEFIKDRPGHDRRYAIDNMKIRTQLNWEPTYSFNEGIEETIIWYMKNKEWINNILNGEYKLYYEKMYGVI